MKKTYDVWPGVAYPLGATYDGQGVNFALYSENATAVHVCLFDPDDPAVELGRISLIDHTNHVFHGYVPELQPGTLYGFRVSGPWAPERGHWFNPNKLLADPYARAFSGGVDWNAGLLGYSTVDGRRVMDERDSAPGVPKGVVIHDAFDWRGDRRPEIIWRKAVLYELHVKGFTKRHPGIPEHLRGTYAGLAHPAAIEHLVKLGVTSVELLPVHECVAEGFLAPRQLTNYWGYNTLGFFAPDQRLAASVARGGQVREFKEMVLALHQAGIEVILDVVYNHTCEGNEHGPTLSFRGIDNAGYYALDFGDRSRYRDFTGCGNALAARRPQVLKLITDSLRYWVTEMHVDGFRFDLCTTIARNHAGDFEPESDFFSALYQDPILSRVKLIAEPWDLGPHGYRVGEFPLHFAEWNDRYRQTLRKFWRGDSGQLGDLGYRLAGSSDLFKLSGRRPAASVNYVTCHDGFTLRDLVSFSHKHNLANAEENRDGTNDNQAFNCGAEGPSTDAGVRDLRDRMSRNLLASLLLSVGTPMVLAGDELGRTQRGNNNAYCQDNEISWVDWNLDERQRALLSFVRRCIKLRRSQPVLQRRNFFLGATLEDSRFRDLVWFHPTGRELEHHDWENPELRCFGMFLGGDAISARDPKGQKMSGDTLLIYINGGRDDLDVVIPPRSWGGAWDVLLETATGDGQGSCEAGEVVAVPRQSLIVLRQHQTG
jgi:glycogen operon protein